jgi:cyanosortase A-associated protein
MTLSTNRWQTVRIGVCAVLLLGILLETGRALFLTTVDKNKIVANSTNSIKFPSNVPLSDWQLVENKLIAPSNGNAIGHLYQYRNQKNEKVDIQVHYEPYTEGNIGRLMMIHGIAPPASALLTIKEQYHTGFYALTSYNNRAYLSACINPVGKSTATQEQFTKNKYEQGLSFVRALGWFAGQNDLVDARCLWTSISIPLPAEPSEQLLAEKYQTLEAIWPQWYDWWQPNFEKFGKQ